MSRPPGRTLPSLAVAAIALALAGCGAGAGTEEQGSTSIPAYAYEPYTPQQKLIEQGSRLVVADGCAACHLEAGAAKLAPSFSSFAGHRMTLTSGRRVLVDEQFVRDALLHPGRSAIAGYSAASMLAATRRLDLPAHPQQVAALTAFIEQIGPEPG